MVTRPTPRHENGNGPANGGPDPAVELEPAGGEPAHDGVPVESGAPST
jgi:hypothetical protein